MSADVWDSLAPESTEGKLKRDGYGRPMVEPAAGGAAVGYTRVTTFAGSIEDTYNLGRYQQRMVALGLSKRPDLTLSVAAHSTESDEDKRTLNDLCEQAREAAGGSAKATVGTAVHRFCERVDRGTMTLDEVPESHRADVAAYVAAMAPLTIHGIEEFVVIDSEKIGGTFDRIVEIDGVRYVADIKTGSVDYPHKMTIQLALYSRGWLYDPKKPRERGNTGVSQTAGLIIHLPAGEGRCDFYWINLTAGWEASGLCDKVRAFRKRKDLLAPASFAPALQFEDALTLPEPAREQVAAALAIGDRVTVGGIEFTKIGVDPFNAPKHAGADGECPDYGSTNDPCPPGCASGTCVAGHRDEPAAEALAAGLPGTTEVPALEQLANAESAAELEAIWARFEHEWTGQMTEMAAARKAELEATTTASKGDPIGAKIRRVRTPEALDALWENYQAQWTAEHTALAKARKITLHQRLLKSAVDKAGVPA